MNPNLRELRRARIGVFGCFATSGFVMGSWPAFLPSLDARLSLGEARLGTTLLTMELVVIAAMYLSGRLCDRFTSRRVLRWTGPAAQMLLIAPALAPGYPTLLGAAALFGLGIGLTEVSMNAQSVELERHYGRPIVSAFHGFWALGAASAGAFITVGLTLGLGSQAILVVIAVVAAVTYACFTLPLVEPAPIGSRADGRRIGLALPLLVGAAAVVFMTTFAEAGATGWANVHAARVLDTGEHLAPLSFTMFLVAMTVVRLLGDPIRARLGPLRTILYASSLAGSGYALVIASGPAGSVPLAWTGWILAGAGSAVLFPVVFSAAGAAGATGSNLSLLSIAGSGAFLLSPGIVGYVAEATDLTVGLLIPGVLALAAVVIAPFVTRRLVRAAAAPVEGAAAPPMGVGEAR